MLENWDKLLPGDPFDMYMKFEVTSQSKWLEKSS